MYIYQYTMGFFVRLSIPYIGLNMPITFYMNAIFPIIYLLSFFVKYFLMFVALYVILIFLKYEFRNSTNIIAFIESIGYEIKSIKAYLNNIFPYKNLNNSEKCVFIYLILFCIISILIFSYASQMGSTFAEMLITGNSTQSIEANFRLLNDSDGIERKIFIIIMHYDGNYYVTEKINRINSSSEFLNPKIYIIPDKQIKLIEMSRVNCYYILEPCEACGKKYSI